VPESDRRAASAQVGITNACNLACTFCSRDREARSEWTVDSTFEVLSGLARAGTLEVAFGGGEPLAFRGFDGLVRRLATETPLAVHLTTIGARVAL
jgi:MoaA/NifB/PqqE/SkfB family radical SAM enzyme